MFPNLAGKAFVSTGHSPAKPGKSRRRLLSAEFPGIIHNLDFGVFWRSNWQFYAKNR